MKEFHEFAGENALLSAKAEESGNENSLSTVKTGESGNENSLSTVKAEGSGPEKSLFQNEAPKEKLYEINGHLSFFQGEHALPFGTDSLLLSGYMKKAKKAAELGSGSGVLSLLALSKNIFERVDGYEIQKESFLLSKKNAEINGMEHRFFLHHEDLRNISKELYGAYDAVFTNPPYMKTRAGKDCTLKTKQIARHETAGDIYDFCKAASSLLKFGGDFYVVYRPDRLGDLMEALRLSKLEIKRITMVTDRTELPPSMALIHARKGGKAGLFFTKNFVISEKNGEKTEEYRQFIKEGVLNEHYFKPL